MLRFTAILPQNLLLLNPLISYLENHPASKCRYWNTSELSLTTIVVIPRSFKALNVRVCDSLAGPQPRSVMRDWILGLWVRFYSTLQTAAHVHRLSPQRDRIRRSHFRQEEISYRGHTEWKEAVGNLCSLITCPWIEMDMPYFLSIRLQFSLEFAIRS